jgi:AcrR family transcriptional regulator
VCYSTNVADVKSGSLRSQQAAETRRRILLAAADVFAELGFAGARIEDVAARAGVAVPTVYKVFTNKPNLLVGALNLAMSGGDTAALDQQAWFTEQLEEPEPARQLALIARNARRIYDRAAGLLEVVRAAAPLDADLASAWDQVNRDREERSRKTATRLLRKAGRRARLSAADTVLTLLSLTGVELYTTHTRAGRTPEQYERWLAGVLQSSLLIDAGRSV